MDRVSVHDPAQRDVSTPRQCGRCRGMFPGDPTLPGGLDTGWWACPPCRDLLFGPGAMATPTWKKAATAPR
jgi:hypothetical protein